MNPGDGDAVPIASGQEVNYKDLKSKNRLYFVRGDSDDSNNPCPQAPCYLVTERPKRVTFLTESYAVKHTGEDQVSDAAGDLPYVARYQTKGLVDGFTMQGDNALGIDLWVEAPFGLEWHVQVHRTGRVNQLLGSLVYQDDRPYNPQSPGGYDAVPFNIQKTIPLHGVFSDGKTVTFERSDKIRVSVWAEEGEEFEESPILDPVDDEFKTRGTWELIREGQDPASGEDRSSALETITEDAIQAAAWVQDEAGKVTTVLKNQSQEEDERIDILFAIKSAFGVDDLNDIRPTARILLNNKTHLMDPGNRTTVDMRHDQGLQDPSMGFRVWRLPADYWNYHDAPRGQYTAVVSAPSLRDDNRSGTLDGVDLRWMFLRSDQSARLEMFGADVQEHTVLPGESTTFLVNVTNRGSAPDTFTLDLGSSAISQGWRAEMRADNLQSGDQLRLRPGATQLVQVTVHAPSTATVTEQSLFTLEATSTLDRSAKASIGLLSTVDDEVRRNVGLLTLGADEIRMGSRDNATAPIYVWNRGTVPTNFQVAIDTEETTVPQSWAVAMRHGGVDDQGHTVTNVPAGSLVKVDLKFETKGNLDPSERFPVTVNATFADNPNLPARKVVTAVVELTGGVRLDVLKAVSGAVRYMEMECSVGYQCPDNENGVPASTVDFESDGLDATWFRVWITNTGDTKDTFNLRLEGFNNQTLLTADYRDSLENGDGFYDPRDGIKPDLWRRFSDGSSDRISAVEVDAGQTAEVYVKVPHRKNYDETPPERFEFSIVAEALKGTAEDRVGVTVIGNNDVRARSDVLIEAVERPDNYDSANNPLVDITNARDETVESFVRLGEVASYKVRVTLGSTYADSDEDWQSKVEINLKGVNRQDGWWARMKPLDGRHHDWKHNFTFGNGFRTDSGTSYEGYVDREFLVEVHPPNVTRRQKPLAGDHDSVFLEVTGKGPGLSGAKDILELDTTIVELPDVEFGAVTRDELVQVGKTTAFILYMDNNASAGGDFRLRVDGPAGWGVDKGNHPFEMKAHENRTIALLVEAPGNAEPGQVATFDATLEWEDPRQEHLPESRRTNITRSLTLTATVVSPGSLRINADQTAATLGPGGETSFPLSVLNTDTETHRVRLSVVSPANWTGLLSHGTNRAIELGPNGNAQGTDEKQVSLTVKAPGDVIEGSSYAFVVKAVQSDGVADDDTNFALMSFTVTISEGEAQPVLRAEKGHKLVERGGYTLFRVDVRNVGTATNTFPLILADLDRNRWSARVEDDSGLPIDSIQVRPNERKTVWVNVTAPFEDVRQGTSLPVRLTAYASDFRAGSKAELTLRADVQDYGVGLRLEKTRVDFVPGTDHTLRFNITNRGNGNDTLNVSLDLEGLEGLWSVFFDRETVRLHPGESRTLHAVVRSPKSPLPSPRSLTFRAWAGTVGGADVEQWKNITVPVVVNVLDYRAQDVDEDGFLELAVDRNRRSLDGFEMYREIYRQGGNATRLVSLDGDSDGKMDFLLDDPAEVGLDGIADIYWDPDNVVVYRIQYTPDVNDDASPDYLLDTDGDGFIDKMYDTVTRTLGHVTSKRITGEDGTRQYLISTNGDRIPDRYFDPVKGIVTDVRDGDARGVVGIDTTGDGRVNKYYDTNSETVRDAKVANFAQFASQYWYLFGLFLLVVVVFSVVLWRRRDSGSDGE